MHSNSWEYEMSTQRQHGHLVPVLAPEVLLPGTPHHQTILPIRVHGSPAKIQICTLSCVPTAAPRAQDLVLEQNCMRHTDHLKK